MAHCDRSSISGKYQSERKGKHVDSKFSLARDEVRGRSLGLFLDLAGRERVHDVTNPSLPQEASLSCHWTSTSFKRLIQGTWASCYVSNIPSCGMDKKQWHVMSLSFGDRPTMRHWRRCRFPWLVNPASRWCIPNKHQVLSNDKPCHRHLYGRESIDRVLGDMTVSSYCLEKPLLGSYRVASQATSP